MLNVSLFFFSFSLELPFLNLNHTPYSLCSHIHKLFLLCKLVQVAPNPVLAPRTPFFFLQHLIWYYEFLMWQDLCRTYICNAKLQWTSSDFKPQILSTALRMWCEPAVAQQEVSSWFFDNAWFFEPAWYILYVEYTYLYNKYAFNYSVMQLWLNYLSTQ